VDLTTVELGSDPVVSFFDITDDVIGALAIVRS
jgi:hypothetical protein